MSEYNHFISGFFVRRDEAESTLSSLVERGLPRDRLQIFKTDSPSPAPATKEDSNAVLKDVLIDGTVGAAVGTGIGALAAVALVAANVSLIIASPLLAPLVLLGWCASIGGLIGATSGAVSKTTPDSEKNEVGCRRWSAMAMRVGRSSWWRERKPSKRQPLHATSSRPRSGTTQTLTPREPHALLRALAPRASRESGWARSAGSCHHALTA